MAKKKQLTSLKNYTLDELLSMSDEDLNKMNKREMRHAVRTLNLVANKRINRLTKAVQQGRQGVSDRGLYTGQGDIIEKFTISRSADLNEARHKFKVVAHYLNRKTTTIEGAMKEFTRQTKQLFDETDDEDISFTNDELKELWEMYRKLEESGTFTTDFDSEKTQRRIGEMYQANKYTNEEIFNKVRKELKAAYNEEQRKKTTTSQLARHRQSRNIGTAADLRDKIRGL